MAGARDEAQHQPTGGQHTMPPCDAFMHMSDFAHGNTLIFVTRSFARISAPHRKPGPRGGHGVPVG